MSTSQSILGVIFDLDGTLVDSHLDFHAMRREIGLPHGTPLLEAVASLSGDKAARAWAILERHERQGAAIATVIPGVRELLDELHRRNIRVAVVTRNGREFARDTLARLELSIDLLITRDDAPPKPSPDAILQIIQSWQLPAHRVAMIGDYRFDLEAGRAAGTKTVLYAADCTRDELVEWQPLADFVATSFVDDGKLLAWLEAH
jgi:HAD superfamily hydrolase (TIGR01509 family)